MEVEGPESDEDGFATLRFEGLRFAHANLPLDLFDNIAAYQRILRELAVEIWREKNPEKARLPRGFRDQLSLSFAGVRNGSAKAAVRRDPFYDSTLPFRDHGVDYLSLAQARFFREAQAANDNLTVSALPHTMRTDLKLLADDLTEGDRLNIISTSGVTRTNPSVRYSPVTAARMINAVRKPQAKEISGRAIVSGIDDPLERLKLTSKFGVFSFPITRERLRSEFSDSLNQTVKFSAFVHIGIKGTISNVLEARALERTPPSIEGQRLSAGIDSLASLRDGWRDGIGSPITKRTLHWARDLSNYLSEIYSGISAFPTELGGINFEFSHKNIEVIVSLTDEMILLEAFDDSDADMKSQAFFAVTPKLLSHLDDLGEFIA
jgi:hypothetical protein